jgi:hypothetical protein
MESDADGFSSSLLYHIVDHKCSGEAIRMADKYITTKTGTNRMGQTTVGWKFLVEWANSSWQWIDLKILKESNPVQVALPLHGGCLTSLFWLWSLEFAKQAINMEPKFLLLLDIQLKLIKRTRIRCSCQGMGIISVSLSKSSVRMLMHLRPGWHKASGHIIFWCENGIYEEGSLGEGRS